MVLEFVGYWWDATDEGKKHYGRLIFDPLRGGKLIIMGTFKNIVPTDIKPENFPNIIGSAKIEEKKFIEKVYGITDLGKHITLFYCYEGEFNYTLVKDLVVYKTTFAVSRIMVGIHHDNQRMKSVEIGFSLLNKWISDTTMGGSFDNDYAFFGTEIMKDEIYKISDEVEVSFKKSPKIEVAKDEDIIKRASIESDVSIEIHLVSKMDMEIYLEYVNIFQIFLCLLIGLSLDVRSVKFTSYDHFMSLSNKDVVYPQVELFQILDQKSTIELDVNSFALFKHIQIKKNLGLILSNYHKNYFKYQICFDLFFSSFYNNSESQEVKFLNYIHGLETLHRLMFPNSANLTPIQFSIFLEKVETMKLNAEELGMINLKYINGISLSKRLREIIDRYPEFSLIFKNKKTISSFLFSVVQTRNYYTHHDNELKDLILRGQYLILAVKKLQLLFHFYLLILLGFQPKELISLLLSHPEYNLLLKNDI